MHNFYEGTHVNFTRINKIETMHVRSRGNVKVEARSTLTFMGGLSYIASISFTRVNFPCVCTEKLREINPKGHFLRVSGKTFLKHPRSSKFVCVKSSLQLTCKFIPFVHKF